MKFQLETVVLGASLAAVARAAPAAGTTVTAAAVAGSTTTNIFPPTGTKADTALFPDEDHVGYPKATKTGLEPAAIKTAASYPDNSVRDGQFPLVVPKPLGDETTGETSVGDFDVSRHWGNLSPWYSLSSADYGLPDASPLLPEGCDITQVHLLYRHGARYPTTGAGPSTFAAELAEAVANGTVTFEGDLGFLANWTYKLGAELLTPFGRNQNFQLGVQYRQLYGQLLNNFTEQGAIPVFRTESQDRMVKTAHNFAAGFFGVPEYLSEVNIEILVEKDGVNNSGAPYDTCTNSNVDEYGSIGSKAGSEFIKDAFKPAVQRFNSLTKGFNFTATDVLDMLQLCSYETNALGYSKFCELFSEEDFLNYEYYYDLSFYYNNGPGSPVAAAQGKAYLQEFYARFTGEYPENYSSLNSTYDDNDTYFPLNQSIYADATHEVVVMDTLTAFNLTALYQGPPLDVKFNRRQNNYAANKLVPFGTHFTVQVLECPAYQPTKQIRFIVNDAVVPVSPKQGGSYEGCPEDPNGLCSFDNVVKVLGKRIDEIDWDHACLTNYTVSVGNDYNGLAPKE